MPKQKPIPLRQGETVYVDGRAMKVTHAHRGGFQLWVPAYCKVSKTDVEVVPDSVDQRAADAV